MMRQAALAIFLLGSTAFPAAAATTVTDWIDTEAAEKMAAEMREKQIRLIDLDCQQNPSGDAETTVFRMSWEPNDDNRQWSWREAGTLVVKGYKRDFQAKGFKLVLEKSFTMASGAERTCALWHR